MADSLDAHIDKKPRTKTRVVLFCVFVVLLFTMLSVLLTPTSKVSGNDNAYKIYEQPENTVEVFFTGASTIIRGVSPNKLFEDYGIAAFNGSTSRQSPLTSLYVIKDAMRSQGSCMRIVVADASPLLYNEDAELSAQEPMAKLNDMQLSNVKFEFLMAASKKFGERINVLEELIPLIKYHGRWNELEPFDFGIKDDYYRWGFSHGQTIDYSTYISNVTQKRPGTYTAEANKEINDERSFPEDVLKKLWNPINVDCFEDLVEYCKDQGLELILIKLPMSGWGDLEHDSMMLLADRCGIPFIDMSQPSVLEKCNLSYATDYSDDRHPNIYGSEKLTDYLGAYLADHYDLSDARLDSNYDFMEEDLAEYHRALNDTRLLQCNDLDEYLDLLENDRYIAFFSLKSESKTRLKDEESINRGLNDAIRAKLSALGLDKLSKLKQGTAYVGVVSGGHAIAEKTAKGEAAIITGSFKRRRVLLEEQNPQPNAKNGSDLLLESKTNKGNPYAVISVGEKSLSENDRGINIAVYDSKTGILLDTSCFDIYAGTARTSDIAPASKPNGA